MIKVFLIAAISADGFISPTQEEISTSWTGKSDKKRFVELTKDAGVVVMGSKTYETIGKPLKDRLNLIYSRTKTFEEVESVSESPVELIDRVEKLGYTKIAICGGAEIYSMFLNANIVDEIYLTIEPILFGSGIKFLSSIDSKHVSRMTILNSEINEDGSIFVHYKINK